MQAKRIQVSESDLGAAGTQTTFLTVPDEPREEINFHNIHGSINCEPTSADANAQGNWALYIIPDGGSAKTLSDSAINNEVDNPRIIATGVWGASNQSSYQSPDINPKTSRNLQSGDILALGVTVTGVTAGVVSTKIGLSAHTTRK